MDDLLYFKDEEGNEIALQMIDNFDAEGNSYALLATPADAENDGIYVMRLDEKDGEMSFAMPDDDEMEKITPVVMERLEALGGSCSGDCCSCGGCGHDESHDECEHEHCSCDHCK